MSTLVIPPPDRFNVFDAKRYTIAGYQVRRAIWGAQAVTITAPTTVSNLSGGITSANFVGSFQATVDNTGYISGTFTATLLLEGSIYLWQDSGFTGQFGQSGSFTLNFLAPNTGGAALGLMLQMLFTGAGWGGNAFTVTVPYAVSGAATANGTATVTWSVSGPIGGFTPAVLQPPLAWISWIYGVEWIMSAAFNRVVTAADVTIADMMAEDWTILAPDQTTNDLSNPTQPGNGNNSSSNSSGGGGGSNNNSGAGGGGGGSSSSGGASSSNNNNGISGGGADDSGSPSGPGVPPRPPPQRQAPGLHLDMARSDDSCVPRISVDGVNKCIEAQSTSNSWFGNLSMDNDPNAQPGEIWIATVTDGKTATIIFNGTITAGSSVGVQCSESGAPGSGFDISAQAFLPFTGLTASTSYHAQFPDSCAPDPGCNPPGSNSGPPSGNSGKNGGGSSGGYVPPP